MIKINQAVTKIINKYDILKLFEYAVPDDEYESEIEEICSELPKIKSIEDLANLIQEIFYNSSRNIPSNTDYMVIAKTIVHEIIQDNLA